MPGGLFVYCEDIFDRRIGLNAVGRGEDVAAAFCDDVEPVPGFGPAILDSAVRQRFLCADETAEGKLSEAQPSYRLGIHTRRFRLHGVENIEAHIDEGWHDIVLSA